MMKTLQLYVWVCVMTLSNNLYAGADHDHKEHSHEENSHEENSHEEHGDHAEKEEHEETKTSIDNNAAIAAGITTEVIGAATIRQTLPLFGRIEVEPHAVYNIAAKYSGIVKNVAVEEGSAVKKDQLLATIENSNTLQNYNVLAPADGVILSRHVSVGDAAGDQPLMILADVSRRMVELQVFPADLSKIALGQTVDVTDGNEKQIGTVEHIAPISKNNSTHVHVKLTNAPALWRPGLSVNANIVIAQEVMPMAVRAEAIQDFNGAPTVFVQNGNEYEAHVLQMGKRDSEWVEVLGGIEPGTRYVVKNSYLVKADILKSGACHEH